VASKAGQDREHPAVAVVGLGEIELEQEMTDVALDGAFADDQAPGDGGVVESLRHQRCCDAPPALWTIAGWDLLWFTLAARTISRLVPGDAARTKVTVGKPR
jgi:hypothetical protein